MARRMKDHYFKLAKKEGYRSRASYKLKQINSRFRIIKRGDTVVDLGASPGGWSQVSLELSGGRVVAVDIAPMKPIEGVEFFKGDITSATTVKKLKEHVKNADVVLCDAAPNLSGRWSYDHARSIELAESSLRIARVLLKPGGNFVVKVFQGDMLNDYLNNVRESFRYVKLHAPRASRKESAEIYVISKKFRGLTPWKSIF